MRGGDLQNVVSKVRDSGTVLYVIGDIGVILTHTGEEGEIAVRIMFNRTKLPYVAFHLRPPMKRTKLLCLVNRELNQLRMLEAKQFIIKV